jgi:sugar/nucleoside kinase (ribokinase family)
VVEIAVVGSLNLDTTIRVAVLPTAGATVLGTGHFSGMGGKGANQAVAAARLGRQVALVGMVGADDAGTALLQSLAEAGVETSAVGVAAGVGTGVALITVDDAAANTIVVDPGANLTLGAAEVRRAASYSTLRRRQGCRARSSPPPMCWFRTRRSWELSSAVLRRVTPLRRRRWRGRFAGRRRWW